MPDVSIDSRQLRKLAADLKAVDVTRTVRDALTEAALPLKHDIQRRALGIPTHGNRHTGLRQSLARATDTDVSVLGQNNVRLRAQVDPKAMPAGQGTLPGYVDGTSRREWRHPVFGHRNVWEQQAPHPFFNVTVADHLEKIRAAVVYAADKATSKLTTGG